MKLYRFHEFMVNSERTLLYEAQCVPGSEGGCTLGHITLTDTSPNPKRTRCSNCKEWVGQSHFICVSVEEP